jgi:flagellar biosynthesis component FlhA
MEVLIQSGSCARWCQIELYSLRRSSSFFPHVILITAIVHLEIDSISTKNLGRGTIISSHIPEIISQAMNDLMGMPQYQQHAKKSPKHLAKTTQGVEW